MEENRSMKYVLSGFRTPKPGSLPDLINGAVDFYKGVDFPGMVTVAPTIPVVATHRPFEDAASVEALDDAIVAGNLPIMDSVTKLDQLSATATRWVLREIIANINPDNLPKEPPKYIGRVILNAKTGMGPELLDVVLSNHEKLDAPAGVSAAVGSLSTIILTRPFAHLDDITKATDVKEVLGGMKSKGVISWNHLCESVERRVTRIAFMRRP